MNDFSNPEAAADAPLSLVVDWNDNADQTALSSLPRFVVTFCGLPRPAGRVAEHSESAPNARLPA